MCETRLALFGMSFWNALLRGTALSRRSAKNYGAAKKRETKYDGGLLIGAVLPLSEQQQAVHIGRCFHRSELVFTVHYYSKMSWKNELRVSFWTGRWTGGE